MPSYERWDVSNGAQVPWKDVNLKLKRKGKARDIRQEQGYEHPRRTMKALFFDAKSKKSLALMKLSREQMV